MAKIDIEIIRHSTAHLMAQAIQELHPEINVQLGIGPTIENGFYYDVDMEYRMTDDDLKTIESKMQEIIKRNDPIIRYEVSKKEAIDIFEKRGQKYKVELASELSEDEVISYYTQGEHFIDLCTGPHVESTRQIPMFFKLLNTAGAYWRGDEKRPMLQRVYAACFDDKKKLKDHINFLKEAKERDHRKLGKELDLFHFNPASPGAPFFDPKGTIVYNELINFVRKIYQLYDYKEVITPQILDVELWKTSGHYENYREDMFFSKDDHREMAVKPMNCPCHMLMFKNKKYSYRDLPLRFADFGRLHRNERSGALAGLTRVRSFCQDDAHVFLDKKEIEKEVTTLLEMFFTVYNHFGFENIKIGLSTRPEKKLGDDATWDMAENALRSAIDSTDFDYHVNEGDGAFYGPKIDIQISDAIGRYHQLGTVQLDFQLPEKFDLKFTNSEGEDERPVVIHRALLGSLERFFGVYLEHVKGIFPFWLAPEQVVFVPVNNEAHGDYCDQMAQKLLHMGLRVKVDKTNETLGKKTRNHQKAKVPFMAVIGDKEIENNSLALREYGHKETNSLSLEEAIRLFNEKNMDRFPNAFRS